MPSPSVQDVGTATVAPQEKETCRKGTLLATRTCEVACKGIDRRLPWILANPHPRDGWPSLFMHDEHADPNIDLEFCGLSGHVLPDEAT